MKFAFCLFKYFPFGGLQRDFLRIAEASLNRGHTVDVFTMHWEGEQDSRIPVTIIPTTGWQNHTRVKHFSAQLQPKLAQYDLVLGFNKMPGLDVYFAADTCYQAKALAKHGWWYRLTSRYQHYLAYEKAVFATTATDILLLSPLQQQEFMRFYQTPSERFHALPPGIARDRIAPENAHEIRIKMRQALGLAEDQFVLLLVGSGFKTKGLDRILLGLAALPTEIKNRTQLYVIGKDNPNLFMRLAKKLNILERIHFLGGRNDVPEFLLAADLLLHPAYNENTGTVLLEAVAAGLPVLTTDVCGYADYVKNAGAGIVMASPFRQTEFNQTLLAMLLSDEKMAWQQNGMRFAREADIYSLPERAVVYLEKIAEQSC